MRITKWQPYSDLVNMYDRWNRLFGEDLLDESSKNGLDAERLAPHDRHL